MSKLKEESTTPLSQLPAVDLVYNSMLATNDYRDLERDFIIYCIRDSIERLRRQLQQKTTAWRNATREQLLLATVKLTKTKIDTLLQSSMRRLVNATGVILHTGLGRAPLAKSVRQEISRVTENYCNLELDLGTGKRGERLDHVEELICYLTGAEAAAVVNNNAGAVLIALSALAKGKEVIISRGQLIEIGGSFRLPEVMAQSGAIMREVGTTNKTHLHDYQDAIGEKTAAILVAHSSNYRILGFSEEVAIKELAGLAHQHQLPLIYDLGGGVFLNLEQFNLPYEPVVMDNVRLGVDVVTSSGDKVLGGPQSGILAGKIAVIHTIRKNPLMRALRCDKLILAALAATLQLYLKPTRRSKDLPVFRMLLESLPNQRRRVERFIAAIRKQLNRSVRIFLMEGSSEMGSGALPLAEIPSVVLRIESSNQPATQLAEHFRQGKVPILGYIRDDGFYLNFRTVRDDELSWIAERLQALR